MDEFEKLEQELANYYDQYTLKFRCLAYLQQQIEEIEKNEMADVRVSYGHRINRAIFSPHSS